MSPEDEPRHTEAVIRDHLRLRQDGDVEADLERNYALDVVMMSAEGTHRGHEGVRELNEVLRLHVPEAAYDYLNLLTYDEFGFLQWHARSRDRWFNGSDTFCVREGRIVLQTVHFHGADHEWGSDS